MNCVYQTQCGGCLQRGLPVEEYRRTKIQKVRNILDTALVTQNYIWDEPVFLNDGSRRRAAMAFSYTKGQLILGFNAAGSSTICSVANCLMLTPAINAILADLKIFLQKFCAVKITEKDKRKSRKTTEKTLSGGDILILEADNGIDIVLEADITLNLDHRMEIFDYINGHNELIRFSHRRRGNEEAEPIVEKIKPVIKISHFDVFVAPGMFLQASKQGETALINTVMKYLGESGGQIADLFCGIGTFTYPMAAAGHKIAAYDSNESLLKSFAESVNRQMLHNVSIYKQNLFKYPLEVNQLQNFDAVVFDPPRAGASAQTKELSKLGADARLQKIIAVSCNPHSFVNDANNLISGGFKLKNITLIDQFVYSGHSELVALFTK